MSEVLETLGSKTCQEDRKTDSKFIRTRSSKEHCSKDAQYRQHSSQTRSSGHAINRASVYPRMSIKRRLLVDRGLKQVSFTKWEIMTAYLSVCCLTSHGQCSLRETLQVVATYNLLTKYKNTDPHCLCHNTNFGDIPICSTFMWLVVLCVFQKQLVHVGACVLKKPIIVREHDQPYFAIAQNTKFVCLLHDAIFPFRKCDLRAVSARSASSKQGVTCLFLSSLINLIAIFFLPMSSRFPKRPSLCF